MYPRFGIRSTSEGRRSTRPRKGFRRYCTPSTPKYLNGRGFRPEVESSTMLDRRLPPQYNAALHVNNTIDYYMPPVSGTSHYWHSTSSCMTESCQDNKRSQLTLHTACCTEAHYEEGSSMFMSVCDFDSIFDHSVSTAGAGPDSGPDWDWDSNIFSVTLPDMELAPLIMDQMERQCNAVILYIVFQGCIFTAIFLVFGNYFVCKLFHAFSSMYCMFLCALFAYPPIPSIAMK